MGARLLFSGIAVTGLALVSAAGYLSTAGAVSTEASVEPAEVTGESTEDAAGTEDDVFEWTDDEYLLAKIAMAEAEGEDTEGKALVICVVLNRVYSDSFPDTVEEVIYQDGQFAPVSDGRLESVEPDEDCFEALQIVLDGWDESHGALYFESKGYDTWHSRNLAFLFRHGGHYFYTEAATEGDIEGDMELCYGE